jgi:hypothetical protein
MTGQEAELSEPGGPQERRRNDSPGRGANRRPAPRALEEAVTDVVRDTTYEEDLSRRARQTVRDLNDLHPCEFRRGECIVCSAQAMIEALLEIFAHIGTRP